MLPYVKIPSGKFSNDEYEAGLIATYALEVYQRGVGIQFQLDRAYDDEKSRHEWAGSHTLVTGYDINDQFAGYLEYVGDYNVAADYLPYFSFGWTWQTEKSFQWDLGSKVALTEKGDDFNLFAGFTSRF